MIDCKNIWLRRGSRGKLVTELQTELKAHNYYTLRIDGDYGYYTAKAVKAFQKQNNPLAIDGIFGPVTCQTWKKKYPPVTTTNTKSNNYYCTSVTQPSDIERTNSLKWKHWDDLSNLTKSGAKAHCTKTGSAIATKSGTYNTPAPLTLRGFDFSTIPKGSVIDKVVVHYSQSKTGGCAFTGARFTLVGLNKSLVGNKVTSQGIASSLSFEGVTLDDLNSTTFALLIEYPKNGASDVGRIQLWNVFIEVFTKPAEITITPTVEIPNTSTIEGYVLPKIPVGQWASVRFIINNTSKNSYTPTCDILIPSELALINGGIDEGVLTQNAKANTYTWSGSFIDNQCTCSFRVKALVVGEYNIEIHEIGSDTHFKLPVTVLEEEISVKSGLDITTNKNVVQNKSTSYTIEAISSNLDRKQLQLYIKLPTDRDLTTEIVNLSDLKNNYNGSVVINSDQTELMLKVSIPLHYVKGDGVKLLDSMRGQVPITVLFRNKGYFEEKIYANHLLDDSLVSTVSFVVKSSKHNQLAFVRLPVPKETIDLMADDINYTATSLLRYIPKGSKTNIVTDYKRNLRFGIYNHTTDYIQIDRKSSDYINQKNNFLKYVQFGNICDTKLQAYSVSFTFHEQNPLYYVWVYEYITSENYGELDVEFSDPMMIETAYNKGYEQYGLYLEPVDSVLSNIEDSKCDLDSLKKTNEMVFDLFEDGGILGNPSFVCIGIKVSFDYANNSQCEAQLTLFVDSKNKGYRSVLIPEGAGNIVLGGKYDLFGLSQKQLKNHIEDIEFRLQLLNPYQSDSLPELNHMQVKFYYINLEQMGSGFTVNGVRNEYMGLFFEDFTNEAGTDNNVKYYQTSGTDKTVAYRSNIQSKKLELTCRIVGCTLDESEALLENVIKIFQNDRDKYNKPILKTIWFDHAPDYEYEYVMEDPIKAEPEFGEYKLKIKLVIPSGTSQSRKWVVTADSGANNGVAPVHPTIYLVAKVDKKVELTESVRGLNMLIESQDIQKGDQIMISHEPRTVILTRYDKKINTDGTTDAEVTKTIDLTRDVDLSSTWFYLMGEYFFKSSTAIISKVMFKERW